MPVKEVDDGIHNIYEIDNTSQGQFLSQTVYGNWPVLDYNQWVGKPTQIGTQQNFDLGYSIRQLGFVKPHGEKFINVPLNQNLTQLTPSSEYSRSLILNNPLNTNEFSFGCENFQSKKNQVGFLSEDTCHDQQILTSRNFSIFKSQCESECADSPTLTTNSERSEITEASSDFSFLRGHQQLLTDQQLGTLPQVMQQSGYNDMQLLQRHMMLRQLQELQRQQQLQQLGDVRQHNSSSQFSSVVKQAVGGQFSPLINGTPVHDASQMLRNWMQRAASPAFQEVYNKVLLPQEQGQAVHSMGLPPQQLDVSLYGTPISNTSITQCPHHQGTSNDSVNMLSKASGPTQKSMMSSGIMNPCLGDQSAVPLDIIGLPQGTSMSKQGLQVKNNFGRVQGLNNAFFPGNHQDATPLENDCVQELNGGQEQASWPVLQKTPKQLGPSQGLVPLDPIEAKILYNMDDNIWDAFGGRPDIGTGGSRNALEHPDSSNTFPSIQSGSWSALMQSAVAEASSSDTGVQEDWSGLTFQNTEHSTDNQISNFSDNKKQQTGWIDNNLQSASSFSPKPFTMIADSSTGSSFSGFQQPGIQLSMEQRENIFQDQSHESIENHNPLQKQSVAEGQQVQNFDHSVSAYAEQMFDHSQSDAQHQKSDMSINKKSDENLRKIQQQIADGPHVVRNSYEGVSGAYEKQQNFSPRENCFDCYTSKGMSGHEKGHFEQFKFSGIASSSPMTVDKESLPDFQGNSRASEGLDSGAEHGPSTSTSFHGLVLHDVSAQTSEHMLELLHKVDKTRDNSSIPQFGSGNPNPITEVPGSDSHNASAAQLYTQASAFQGFGLRLAPPLQRLSNTKSFPSPQGLPQSVGSPNSIHANSQLEERSQTWLAPPSPFQSVPSSHELSQRGQWVTKSGSSAPLGSPLYLDAQEKSVSSFTANPSCTRNQLTMHHMSNVTPTSQSLQARLSGGPSRYSPLASLQGSSQQISTNPVGQQFPVLEAQPTSQHSGTSGMSQQGEGSARPHNVWRNIPSQRQPFGTEHHKSPSSLPSPMDQLNNSKVSSSVAICGSNYQNSVKYGNKSSEYGTSQGVDYGEKHHGKKMSQQQLSSMLSDSFQSVGASQRQESASDATAVNHHQSYSLPQQMQAMDNCADIILEGQQAALGGQQLPDNNTCIKHTMDSGSVSATQPSSFPSGNAKLLNFSAEAGDSLSVKASFQPALQARASQEVFTFGHNDFQTQSSDNNTTTNQMDLSQINLRMAPSWFKQYGTYKNGQMVQMFDARLAEIVASQFSFGKQSQNLHIHPSLERLDATQGGRHWPSTATALSRHSSGPFVLPPQATNVVASMRPKKRKVAASELVPWHKEMMQESKKLQNISGAEQDWAQATNRPVDKVEDDREPIEDVQPALRSKRRLILTTRLMQQLFHPAPASVFTADSTSNWDAVSYFVSRSSLGDACHFANYMRDELFVSKDNSNMSTEKHKTSQRGGGEQFLEVLKEFINRAKKIESDFYRLDKATSVVDIRVELQELERFSIINRFAKFHVRGQIYPSEASSSAGMLKPIPQRHVTAFSVPRNLPEGVQCVSL